MPTLDDLIKEGDEKKNKIAILRAELDAAMIDFNQWQKITFGISDGENASVFSLVKSIKQIIDLKGIV